MSDTTELTTREGWLMEAIEHMRGWFTEKCDTKLPETIRVSTGWTKRPAKHSIGWTWVSDVAADKVNNVFISPELDDTTEVLAVLLHELIHVADDCNNGHTGPFKTMWRALGFTGKATCSTPGEELTEDLKGLTLLIGEYPHAKMTVGAAGAGGKTGAPKQGTRMIKLVCPDDGYTARTTKKWLDVGMPSCPCGAEMELG